MFSAAAPCAVPILQLFFSARGNDMRFPHLEPWQRTVWATVVAEILALLAFQAAAILIPYYIQDMGITDMKQVAAWTGAYQSAGGISFAIFTPIWGALGDRYGRKLMLMRAMAATCIILFVMGLAQTPTQLMVLRIIQGCVTGTPAAATALLATGSPRNRLAYTLGLLQTALFVGSSLGPMLGGYIGDLYGYRATFFFSSATLLVAFALVVTLVREPQESAAVAEHARREHPFTALKSLFQLPALLPLIVMSFAINLSYSLVAPVLPIFVQELAMGSPRLASIAGTISGVSALMAAVSALVVGRLSDRIGHRRALLGCAAGTTLFYIPQAFARSTTALGAALGFQGLFRGGLSPNVSAMVVDSASKEKAGTALGLSSSASSIGFAMGPLIGAAILAATSAKTTYLVTATIFGLITVGVALLSRISPATTAGRETSPNGEG